MKSKNILAIIFIGWVIVLIACSCNSTKKLINRSHKKIDSTTAESRTASHKGTTTAGINLVKVDSTTTQKESSYTAVNVDSGYFLLYPINKGYAETYTKKRTIIFLPKTTSLETKATSTKDNSTITQEQEATATESKEAAVVTDESTVTKDIKKKRASPIIWIGIVGVLAFFTLVWFKKVF